MYCPNCGKEISKESKFCRFCGHQLSGGANPASVVAEETTHSTPERQQVANGLAISPMKFLIFNLLTFGLYQAYWGWKNWEIVRRVKDVTWTGFFSMSSGWRGLFIVFTCFSLFKHILQLAQESGYKGNYSPGLLGSGFLAFSIINSGVGRAEGIDAVTALLVMGAMIALVSLVTAPVINAMNYFLTHSSGKASKLDIKPNYGLLIFLIVIFAIYFLAGLFSDTGTQSSYY